MNAFAPLHHTLLRLWAYNLSRHAPVPDEPASMSAPGVARVPTEFIGKARVFRTGSSTRCGSHPGHQGNVLYELKEIRSKEAAAQFLHKYGKMMNDLGSLTSGGLLSPDEAEPGKAVSRERG